MNDLQVCIASTVVALAALTFSGCGTPAASPPAAAAGAAAPSSAAPAAPAMAGMPGMAAMPHGDHNPHHGGIVMMKGEMHYELVLDPTGKTDQLFFTDATRQDLPASIASNVALTVHRTGAADEPIPLQIDESGESWIGSGRPVSDPANTTVRVAFTIAGEPYWIDLPFKPVAK